ncbi:DUF6691 family protein [Halopseudomonas salegens]|uniref:YeeE/YedE family protein n=1 Tax=Halopseudomonas salegens TaxID=1434072 RepID=A0A1H2HM39_9GAMM|nr:DUF6691 family protein [Halopseudomonas salegens]SDU32799.1 hypothetical protein SAMN05216210_3141 [Halopseudomonas salegens]
MRNLIALLSGLMFGLGLIIAGMANPAKVLGFLDLFGQWDPSLALVMGGAIAAAFLPMQWAMRAQTCVTGAPMQLPATRQIDRRLVSGSLLFGAGWGLAGFCPGPAVVALGAAMPGAVIFVLAMLIGMAGFERYNRRLQARD